MTAVVTPLFHPSLASSIYEEIQNRRSIYHYFVGQVLAWDDEADPPLPSSSFNYENDVRNNIVQTKQIQINDIAHVIPRIDWTINTVYDMYDDAYSSTNTSSTGATSLKDSRFYVLTEDFNIYKCIYNNNGALSTVEPSGTSSEYLTTADGYVWKFISFVPLGLRNKFLTSAFIPVTTSVKNRYYSAGVIDSYNILDGGQDYDPNETYAVIQGDGAGPYAKQLSSIITYNIEIKNGTNGFGTGNKYYIDDTVSPILRLIEGNTYRFDVSNSSNDGDLLKFSTTEDGDSNGGTEYTSGVTRSGTAGQPGAYVEITPSVGAVDLHYYSEGNSGYGNEAKTIASAGYDGQADIDLVIENGEITGLIINDGGYGYTDANLVVAKDAQDPGSGASITLNLSTGDLDTQQANVELLAVDGEISYIVIENSGADYTSATISIEGDGTGAEFDPVINSAGQISGINITNKGSGYSYANVTINGNGRDATVRAIISPKGGHGKNAIEELLSDTLCFYTSFENDAIQGFTVDNQYRQIGIIKDLKDFGSQYNKYNLDLGSACYAITCAINSELYPEDENIITSGGSKVLRIVSSSDTGMLVQSLNGSIPNAGETFYDKNENNPFTIDSITNPTINKFSGNMLYIDNKQAFTPSGEQFVIFRTFIKF